MTEQKLNILQLMYFNKKQLEFIWNQLELTIYDINIYDDFDGKEYVITINIPFGSKPLITWHRYTLKDIKNNFCDFMKDKLKNEIKSFNQKKLNTIEDKNTVEQLFKYIYFFDDIELLKRAFKIIKFDLNFKFMEQIMNEDEMFDFLIEIDYFKHIETSKIESYLSGLMMRSRENAWNYAKISKLYKYIKSEYIKKRSLEYLSLFCDDDKLVIGKISYVSNLWKNFDKKFGNNTKQKIFEFLDL
jgi:hypothetical protein